MDGLPETSRETPELLAGYLARIARFALLTDREEVDLGSRVRAGDSRARREFIERNLRLVVFVAGRYRGRGMSLEDLIQEGNVGLIRATDRFDPGLGHRFSSYAVWWIREAIGKALTDKGRVVRLPAHVVEKIYRLNGARDELSGELGREPGPEEVGEQLGWSAEVVEATAMLVLNATSLNRPPGTKDGSGEIGDLIEDESASDMPGEVVRGVEAKQLREAVEILPERLRRALVRRYGLDDRHPASLDELATELGISRARASQLQSEAEKALKYRGSRPRTRGASRPTGTVPKE